MFPYQYRHPHVKDKTVSRPSYLYHGNPHAWERRPLYQIKAQCPFQYPIRRLPKTLQSLALHEWVSNAHITLTIDMHLGTSVAETQILPIPGGGRFFGNTAFSLLKRPSVAFCWQRWAKLSGSRAWRSNYISLNLWDVITLPRTYWTRCFAKSWHTRVITSNIKQCMQSAIYPKPNWLQPCNHPHSKHHTACIRFEQLYGTISRTLLCYICYMTISLMTVAFTFLSYLKHAKIFLLIFLVSRHCHRNILPLITYSLWCYI